MNPMFQIFQNFEIKLVVDSVTRWYELSFHYHFAVKEKIKML
jgi:hypothetical protein